MPLQYLSKPSPAWIGDPTTTPSEQLTVLDVLNTPPGTSPNGDITLTLGVASTGEVFTNEAILFNGPGASAIPLPSGVINSDGSFTPKINSLVSAEAICFVRNDQYIIIAIRDVRTQSAAGNVKPGEAVLQAQGAQGKVLVKKDSSVNLITTSDGTSSGQTVGLYIGTDSIVLSNQYGAITIDSTGITITAGQSAITLGANGQAAMLGTTVNVQGSLASISGSVATMVGDGAQPVPGTFALYGVDGIAGLPSANVYIAAAPTP